MRDRSWSRSPLHWAVRLGHKDVVHEILESVRDRQKAISQRTNDGDTVLHLATYHCGEDMVLKVSNIYLKGELLALSPLKPFQ